MPLSGREKATILLSILGADASQRIIEYLPDDMADLLVSGVNNLPKPSPDMLSAVITECRDVFSLPSGPRAAAIEGNVPPPRPSVPKGGKPSEVLSSVSGRALTSVLIRERPQTIAFVLTQLPEGRVSEVLSYLPEQRREVEYLMNNIKTNPLSEMIKDNLLEAVSKKLS